MPPPPPPCTLCPPPRTLCAPSYRARTMPSKLSCKNMARAPGGGAKNMRPLSWGGTNGKDPIYFTTWQRGTWLNFRKQTVLQCLRSGLRSNFALLVIRGCINIPPSRRDLSQSGNKFKCGTQGETE